MSHLHSDACPRYEAGEAPFFYRESDRERLQFDKCGEALSLQPLQQIAMNLDTWGRMSPGGSYAQQCFIMANEALLAHEYLKIMERLKELLDHCEVSAVDVIRETGITSEIRIGLGSLESFDSLKELLENLPQPILNDLDTDDEK